MTEQNKVLFLFTKEFPFGSAEQYLTEEVEFLSASFNSIFVIPTEYFGNGTENRRPVPANFEVLNINLEAKNIRPGKKFEISRLGILLREFLSEEDKFRFLREFRRYFSVLNYQCLLACFFENFLANREEAKEVFFYSYWNHNSAVMLGLLKKRGVIKNFVTRAHSIDLYHNDWPFAYEQGVKVLPFQFFKASMASAVYSVSKKGEQYLRKKYPRIKDKFKTSYLGVSDRGTGAWDRNNMFTLVSCSAINSHKRVTLIAKVFSLLKIPATWVHFGSGSDEIKVRKVLESLPQTLTFKLMGHTPNADIMNFYRNNSVNLFVNLSTVEGIPVSLMEAASFGIPLLATDVFGNSEIANEHTGFLVSENSTPESIAEIISAFADDISLQEKLRQSSRQFCLKNFNNQHNFTEFATEIAKYKN